jgi:hypothetical protein
MNSKVSAELSLTSDAIDCAKLGSVRPTAPFSPPCIEPSSKWASSSILLLRMNVMALLAACICFSMFSSARLRAAEKVEKRL